MKNNKSMVDWVKEYLTYRRGLGYRLQVDEGELIRFAKYVEDINPWGPLTTELALNWVQLAKSTNHQHRRFETIRSASDSTIPQWASVHSGSILRASL